MYTEKELIKIEAAFKQLLEVAWNYRQAQQKNDDTVWQYESRRRLHNARVEFDYFFKSMGVDENTDFESTQINFINKEII